MTPDEFRRVYALLEQALEHPPEARIAFLQEACGSDTELLSAVQAMLNAEVQETSTLDQSVRTRHAFPIGNFQGRRIGPYLIQEQIGQGGMGAVYRAERADDAFRKTVAVKVVRSGVDSDEIQRRFQQERQILAALDHPNIARLLDGGSTPEGLPYFVMEYVEGIPIDQYCDANKMTVAARLRLFRTVCDAVQYAHQNLIVHRDLKPSNILVTKTGVVKLLDFGIAKLLPHPGSETMLHVTKQGVHLMTPAYASPEQVQNLRITTATDVYSLGVVLYELLTGHPPYRLNSRRMLHDIVRIICEEEPAKPSVVITQEHVGPAPVTAEQVSAVREGKPAKLKRCLTGDLDNILLMSLRKEPQRRYASVEQFSEDIRKHLHGLPVVARGDTVAYRMSKFIRRNRVAIGVAATLLLTLTAGVMVSSWQALVAQDERNRADAQATEARDQRSQALQSRARAEQEQRRAEHNLQLAEQHRRRAELEALQAQEQKRAAQHQFMVAWNFAQSVLVMRSNEAVLTKTLDYLEELENSGLDSRSALIDLRSLYVLTGDRLRSPGPVNRLDLEAARRSYSNAARLLTRDKMDAAAWQQLSSIYDKLADTERQLGRVEQALEFSRKSLFAIKEIGGEAQRINFEGIGYQRLADLLAEKGDYPAAFEALRNSLVRMDRDRQPYVHQRLAQLHKQAGQLSLSERSYLEAAALMETFPDTDAKIEDLASLYEEWADLRAQIRQLTPALDRYGLSLNLRVRQLKVEAERNPERNRRDFFTPNDIHMALDKAEEGFIPEQDGPRRGFLFMPLGVWWTAGGYRQELSRSNVIFSLSGFSERDDFYSNAIVNYFSSDRKRIAAHKLARVYMKRARVLSLDPRRAGEVLENCQKAFDLLTDLIKERPDNRAFLLDYALVREILGDTAYSQGNYAASLVHFKACLRGREVLAVARVYEILPMPPAGLSMRTPNPLPALARALAKYARASKKDSDWATRLAIRLFGNASSNETAPAEVLHDYARALLECEPATYRNPAKAREVGEKAAAKTDNKDPYILATLAEATFKSGDAAKAAEIQRKAIALLAPEWVTDQFSSALSMYISASR